jgi:hypothetical protein
MFIIFQFLLAIILNVFAFEEDEDSLSTNPSKLENPGLKFYEKKPESPNNLGYGYRANSSTYRDEFSGKAFYRMPILKQNRSDAFITAGAKVDRSKIHLKDLSSENQTKASAHIGFNRELSSLQEKPRSIHLEIDQPVYDDKGQFSPSVEMSYDLKF